MRRIPIIHFAVITLVLLSLMLPLHSVLACGGCSDSSGCTWSPPSNCQQCRMSYSCGHGGACGDHDGCGATCGGCPAGEYGAPPGVCWCTATGYSCRSVTCPACNDCSPGNNCFCGGACQSYNFGYSALDRILPLAVDLEEEEMDTALSSNQIGEEVLACGGWVEAAYAASDIRQEHVYQILRRPTSSSTSSLYLWLSLPALAGGAVVAWNGIRRSRRSIK